MKINTDSLVTFIIMWGIPFFMVARGFLKMNSEDKKSVIIDFTSHTFISTIGFIVIGGFFIHVGTLLGIAIIKFIGIVLLTLGGIFSVLDLWRDSKVKSILILILVSAVIFINVN